LFDLFSIEEKRSKTTTRTSNEERERERERENGIKEGNVVTKPHMTVNKFKKMKK